MPPSRARALAKLPGFWSGGYLRPGTRAESGARTKAQPALLGWLAEGQMIDQSGLADLLKRHESSTLDFKRTEYDLKASLKDMAKDILAMANTPREEPARIVFGVDYDPASGAVVCGLASVADDTMIQDAVEKLRLFPRPHVTYEPVRTADDQLLAVLTIPIQVPAGGPFQAQGNGHDVPQGVVFYREGSRNSIAQGARLSEIVRWFSSSGESSTEPLGARWDEVRRAIGAFDESQPLVLVADVLNDAAAIALGELPWVAVLDFDRDTERSGLHARMARQLARHRVVHLAKPGDQPDWSTASATLWYSAIGLPDSSAPPVTTFAAWRQRYRQQFRSILDSIATSTAPIPVTFLLLWEDSLEKKFAGAIVDEIATSLAGRALMVLLSSSPMAVDDDSVQIFAIPRSSSLPALACEGRLRLDSDSESRIVRDHDGAPHELPLDSFLDIQEDLEILTETTGLATSAAPPDEFRRVEPYRGRDFTFTMIVTDRCATT